MLLDPNLCCGDLTYFVLLRVTVFMQPEYQFDGMLAKQSPLRLNVCVRMDSLLAAIRRACR